MGTSRLVTLALLAAAAVASTATAGAAAPATTAEALRPVGTPLRVVILPVRLRGEPVPSAQRLRRLLDDTRTLMARASRGRIVLSGEVAPTISAGRYETSPRFLDPRIFGVAVARASARGVTFAGAVPVFVAASRQPSSSYGSTAQVLLQGTGWREAGTLAHELGHALGLEHAVAPTGCRRPFSPLGCLERPANIFEYGDALDIMGYGGDRFGAYAMAVLGLAPVTDAPAGTSATRVRPVDGPRPTLLRLRTADGDWFVESRRRAALRYSRPVVAPRGVAVSRVPGAYSPAPGTDLYPRPVRLPATDPQVTCRADGACLARQVLAPRRVLTVPGAFRLKVAGGRVPRVVITWLDRTPPAVGVASARVVAPVGGVPELLLGVTATARGAGVLTLEITQGDVVTSVPADDVPGLVVRGAGQVRVPRGTGAQVSVTAVDAAGHRSAPAVADLSAVPVEPGATTTFTPALGAHRAVPTPLPAGGAVTVSGTTDPGLAGLTGRVDAVSTRAGASIPVEIGAGGVFSVTWTPPAPGVYRLTTLIPVAREPFGIELVYSRRVGYLRA